MTKRNDVERFLAEFKVKTKFYNIVFRDDRGKNQQTLLDLDITPTYRLGIINRLTADDYSEGPLTDKLNKGTDLWVFGSVVKQREVYIKITMGNVGCPTICISFHLAEHPITYKFK